MLETLMRGHLRFAQVVGSVSGYVHDAGFKSLYIYLVERRKIDA